MHQFEQFGKYVLLEKLASGGMAEVYLAKSTGANGVNKFLAIKRILPQFSENPEFIDMFKEEAKIAVNLNHSNVVSIFDFGIELNQFFLVMEYVEGRNLRQIINELKKNNYKFSTEQIVYMIKEVAAGLDHAHRCIDGSTGRPLNITHRDMSPQNIMVSFEGEVKIIDFGIAKAETQLEATKAGTLKGKFGYMSPEQADGLPIDLRTDIFSLGIVLWELLANDRLFAASSEAAILRKIRDCEIPPIRKLNPSVSPELERIVMKALTKDKNVRYQNASAMHRDLNRFLNTQYPEFTPNDFSVFVKNTFGTAFQAQKQKLVEYSQVQLSTNRSPQVDLNKTSPDAAQLSIHDDEQLSINTNVKNKVDLKDLNQALDKNDILGPRPANTQTAQPVRPKSGITRAKSKSSGSTSLVKKSNNAGGFISAIMILVGIIILSSWQLKIPMKEITKLNLWKEKLQEFGYIENSSFSPKKEEKVPIPIPTTPSFYNAVIKSNPSGATIFIDGEKTENLTPAQIQLPANKQTYITLKKDDYLYAELPVSLTKEAESFDVNLKSEPMGYLNIEIILGAGSNPFIELNGQRLGDKLPIQKYPVPVNRPLRIKGVNPYTQAVDEQIVTLSTGERKDIKLVLRVGTNANPSPPTETSNFGTSTRPKK